MSYYSHEFSTVATQTPERPPAQAQYSSYSDNPPPPPPKASGPDQDASQYGTPFQAPAYTASTQSPRPQPPLPNTPSYSSTPAPAQHPQEALQPQIPPPQYEEHWLPTAPPISSFTTAELAPVLQNSTLLSALASTHPSHASSLQPLSTALSTNIALAEQVSRTETQLAHLREQTQQLLLQHTTLSTQWRRKQSEMDNALSPWGPRAMYQRLVSSINEQEGLVRAMQESFLEGGGGEQGKASEQEVGEWIRRIREGTTVLEKRREMRARWDEGRVGGWR